MLDFCGGAIVLIPPEIPPARRLRRNVNLSPEILTHINEKVREGFQAKEDLLVAFCEEMYEPGELDEDEVSAALDAAFERLAAEQLAGRRSPIATGWIKCLRT